MNEARKQKAYNLIEGISSRTKMLDSAITGVKRIEPSQARNIISEITKLNNQLRELVDIS